MTNMTKKIVLIASIALVVIVATVLVLGIFQTGDPQDPQLSGTEGTTTATQGSVNDSTQGTNSTQGGTNDPTQGGANDPTQGGANDPTQGGNNDPTQGGANDPTQGGTNDPTQGGANDPTQGGSNDPTQGGSNDPTQGNDNPVHSHSYTATVTKASTCTERGVKTYTCSCGDSYTEEIARLSHKYEETVVEPTCTEGGYTTCTCSGCGNSYKTLMKSALGHKWTSWESDGYGKYTRECRNCGKREGKEELGNPEEDTDYTKYFHQSTAPKDRIDPNGDPNGDPFDFVRYADPLTGLSWDGKSPIIYTYEDGTTGTTPQLGATYYSDPYTISTVNAYDMGWITYDEFSGGASDSTCLHCGKPMGNGLNGTCVRWMAGSSHVCPNCGETVATQVCHTCK